LLKNIESLKSKGVEPNPEWIRGEVLSFKIPLRVLEELGIQRPDPVHNTTFSGSASSSSPSKKSPLYIQDNKKPKRAYSTENTTKA